MKKFIMFFSGIFLIAMTVGMLFLTSVIYDSVQKTSVDTYFFQRNLRSIERPGRPETLAEIGETTLREMFIKKFVTEYFYVIPDPQNIAIRRQSRGPLAYISLSKVFNNWVNTTAEQMQQMAEQKMMRTVQIDGEIVRHGDSNYWIVPYILHTWESANDMDATPVVTRGKLLIKVHYEPGRLRGQENRAGDFLKTNYNSIKNNPIQIFYFWVEELEEYNE